MGWSNSQACFAKADLSTWHLAQQSLCSFCLSFKLQPVPQYIPYRMCKEFGKHQVLNYCPFYLCGSREVVRFSGWNNDILNDVRMNSNLLKTSSFEVQVLLDTCSELHRTLRIKDPTRITSQISSLLDVFMISSSSKVEVGGYWYRFLRPFYDVLYI